MRSQYCNWFSRRTCRFVSANYNGIAKNETVSWYYCAEQCERIANKRQCYRQIFIIWMSSRTSLYFGFYQYEVAQFERYNLQILTALLAPCYEKHAVLGSRKHVVPHDPVVTRVLPNQFSSVIVRIKLFIRCFRQISHGTLTVCGLRCTSRWLVTLFILPPHWLKVSRTCQPSRCQTPHNASCSAYCTTNNSTCRPYGHCLLNANWEHRLVCKKRSISRSHKGAQRFVQYLEK